MKKNILVLAPHPDDEVLGCGGTLARMAAEGNDVYVIVVTTGTEPMFPKAGTLQCREDARRAHMLLGIKDTVFLEEFPAALLDTIPHSDANRVIREVIDRFKPNILFIPYVGDIHFDHRLVFEASLVACRPNGQFVPDVIYAYETLSETNWGSVPSTPAFTPNVYYDISRYLDLKLQAFSEYRSEVKEYPSERSLEAIKALAMRRGSTVFCHAAEAFVLIRSIHKLS